MIQLLGISKTYKSGRSDYRALKNVSLTLRDNEFAAILGPSGSGKTTLLNVIGGLDHYDEGDLVIDGISTKKYSDRDWDSYRNHSIGFVFQSYNLIAHQTILSNVELALTIAGISKRERTKRAKEALEKVGLGDQIHKLPSQLSGGQMQRVAIARALINNPSVLLADEPTGALDSKTSLQVMELLKEVAKDRLVVMVTHNPELASAYASRIITLKDGEIQSDSDPVKEADIPKVDAVHKNMGRASMGFGTSLALSFKNLWTKRKRTILTAFAGSIGIIGIALIVALSVGVTDYINQMEANMLFQYPIRAESLSIDLTGMLGGGREENVEEGAVRIRRIVRQLFMTMTSNDLKSLKKYTDSHADEILPNVETIEYVYSVSPYIYWTDGERYRQMYPDITLNRAGMTLTALGNMFMNSMPTMSAFHDIPNDEVLYKDSYDVVAGRWPENAHEAIVVLTSGGGITDYSLYMMGLEDPEQLDRIMKEVMNRDESGQPIEIQYPSYFPEDFLNVKYRIVVPADFYEYDEENELWRDRSGDEAYVKALLKSSPELTIVGVVTLKPGKTSGALNSGINVSSELRLEVIRESMKRKIVKDQLKNPDVNVFTGVPFDAESFDRDLNFSSLIDVDTDKIREAIRFDAADLEDDFLNALDFSKFNFPAPSIDLSRYLNFDDVLTIPEEDLKELFRSISFDPASFRPLIEDVLKGYGDFLAEKGYLDVDVIFGELRNYFGSESFRQTVNDWIASIEDADDPAETDRLGDLILKDINEYFTSVGLPAFPYVSNSFREYMESDEFRDIVFRDLSELPNLGEVEETVKNYVKDRFLKLFQEKYQEISSAVIRDVQAQLLGSVKGALADMFTDTMEKLGESMEQLVSIDAETFLSAFDVKMSAAEMQEFLSSFTAYAGGSAEKNLSALGYQDPDDPTAIYYYPSSFETKANVLAFLDGYNALMEKQNRAEEKISYTDTLGVVLSTVTEIVDIISYVLIAAVAVSLLVSSIMIGVITYISVLERRKEIGILRALGASKRNIANVFNAETAITGFAAGMLGALLSYALLLPINLILRHATGIDSIRAWLPPEVALILVTISVLLTVIGGLIPSKSASKSDPVLALRAE